MSKNETPSFKHLNKLQIDPGKSIEFTFFNVVGEPTLFVRPTTQENKRYLNAVLSRGNRTIRRMRGNKITVAVLSENRAQDRELFPKYVVTGWKSETVLDAKGRSVPFSEESCAQFLEALPNDIFDELRTFCGEPENWRERDELNHEDVKDLAGNSGAGSSGK